MTDEHRRLLAERRAELAAQLAAVQGQLSSIRDARSAANDDDEHDPEGSTLSAEWSRAEGLRADIAREQDELDAAEHRLADGTYGVCASCGRAIPIERLRLRPAAALCVPCASSR